MACGVYLGILVIFVQAEHVCCSWSTQAQRSQRQNDNIYAGLLQQGSGLRHGSNYPQNQFRQASTSQGSETAGSSGYTQAVSQHGHASARAVQSGSLSEPNWRTTLKWANAQLVPEKLFDPSNIGSAASLTKYSQTQTDLTDSSKQRIWPVKGTPRASQYPSSSSAQSPSRERVSLVSTSHQSAAQKPPSTAVKMPRYNSQLDLSPSKKVPFSTGAFEPQQNTIQMQTSASGRAWRVSSPRQSGASIPSHNPGKAVDGKPHQSVLFLAENTQESYKPAYNVAFGNVNYAQSFPATYKQNAPAGFEPRSLKMPPSSSTSTQQLPGSSTPGQAMWNSRNQAQPSINLPASGSSRVGASPQRYAPTTTHEIPERFGGYAIRRLKKPADQRTEGVQKPMKTYAAPPPQQTASQKPQRPSVDTESKWKRMKLHQRQ